MYYKVNIRLAAVNFDILAASVNGTERRTVLRKQHREYLMELVRMANMQGYAHTRDTGAPAPSDCAALSTNSPELAKTLGCCERTIRNYNALLERYGIVERVFHGTPRNYTLRLNRYICPVVNADDSRDYPLLHEADKGGIRDRAQAAILRLFFSTAKRQNFPHRYIYSNILNNQPMEKGVSDGQTPAALLTSSAQDAGNGTSPRCTAVGVATMTEYVSLLAKSGFICSDDLDTCLDTGAEPAADEPSRPEPRETAAASAPVCPEVVNIEESEERMRQMQLDDYKQLCARMLLSYAMERIPSWKKRVYPGVADEVAEQIREQYFDELRNKWQCSYILSVAYQTIQVASRYIRKKLTSGRWTEFRMMPPTYFNRDTEHGFAHFFSKMLAAENDRLRKNSLTEQTEALKYYERQRRINNMKFNRILKAYFDRPTADNYQRCLALVKETLPQRVTMFQQCVYDAQRRQATFWKQQQNVAVSPKIMR